MRNKLINLLSQWRGFKFVTALVLKVKKSENDYEIKFTTFYSNPKSEVIINGSDLNQFILQLYQTYKVILEKVLVGLLIQL